MTISMDVLLFCPLFKVFKNPEHCARALLSTLKVRKLRHLKQANEKFILNNSLPTAPSCLQTCFFKFRIALLRSGHWSYHSCLQHCSKPSGPPKPLFEMNTGFTQISQALSEVPTVSWGRSSLVQTMRHSQVT